MAQINLALLFLERGGNSTIKEAITFLKRAAAAAFAPSHHSP